MKKILILIVALMFIVCAHAEYYINITMVIRIDEENEIVVVTDETGNEWEFYGCEGWNLCDICILIMDDMGTDEIYDDTIINLTFLPPTLIM